MNDTIAPKRRGLSTGLKLLIGCIGVGILGIVLLAVTVGAGGLALLRGASSVAGGFDDHREATDALSRLEREYPFDAPADGIVTEDQLRRFLAVTDAAWEEMRPWGADLRELQRYGETGRRPGLGGLFTGARAIGGFARARLVLADALSDHEMSLGEYAWTGIQLARATESSERPGDGGHASVPQENRALVERHRDALPRFHAPEQEPGRSLVLAVGVVWGMAEVPTWQALGLDTLRRR